MCVCPGCSTAGWSVRRDSRLFVTNARPAGPMGRTTHSNCWPAGGRRCVPLTRARSSTSPGRGSCGSATSSVSSLRASGTPSEPQLSSRCAGRNHRRPLPGNGNLAQALRAAEPGLPASTPIPGPVSPLLITEMGDVETGLAQAAKTVSGTFSTSYLLHGPTGPHNAVADVTPTGATIYHQCGPNYGLAAQGVAQAIGVPQASVREISYQGSSFYGGAQHRPRLPHGSSRAVKGRRKAGARPVHALGRHGI